MLEVIYYRTEAEVTDLRLFRTEEEFDEWKNRQNKLEPIIVISKESH